MLCKDAVLCCLLRKTDRSISTAAGVVDQTRGILTYCSDACPGAFHDSVGGVSARAGLLGRWDGRGAGSSWHARL